MADDAGEGVGWRVARRPGAQVDGRAVGGGKPGGRLLSAAQRVGADERVEPESVPDDAGDGPGSGGGRLADQVSDDMADLPALAQ